MRKFTKLAVFLAVAIILPGVTLASNGNNKSHRPNVKLTKQIIKTQRQIRHVQGSVTAVGSTSFTLKTADNIIYTVNTGNAKIMKAFGAQIQLADLRVNDKASASGSVNGSAVEAKTVVITPANTHVAKGGGTVTGINGNALTVQMNSHGILSSFTVHTNASTTYTTNGSTTTASAVQVGSKIKVKGLWDELLNVLNAIKIRIK